MRIKKLMSDILIFNDECLNQTSLIEYENKLFKTLDMIEIYLTRILLLYGNDEKEVLSLKEKIEAYRDDFINVQGNVEGIKAMCLKNIANMRKEFITSVRENYFGYYIYRGQNIMEPVSINEYLYLLHSSIVNNEQVYYSMPEIEYKGDDEIKSIHLYGRPSEIAYEIFKDFPIKDIRTDVLSLSDRILILARDLGHSLMVEITFQKGKAIVSYFIPKVVNYLMVNELNGVNKVNEKSSFATGSFEVNLDLLKDALFEFVMKMPMDEDMYKKGGLYYEEETGKSL